VREGKEGLFEERLYARVFPTGDPLYYLGRYWLMKEVSYCARGYPERAYAKWVVLNFVWSQLAPALRGKSALEAFRQSCERQRHEVVVPLSRAIDRVFRAALAFYRAKRGKGATALDVSTFFKRKKLDREFARYWTSSRNSHRGSFRGRIKNAVNALSEE
jgi:hypothetical protein